MGRSFTAFADEARQQHPQIYVTGTYRVCFKNNYTRALTWYC